MPAKIVELQGLRCIAIISVLLYHIWPEFFVNGFLGVDIFFVISGYFMALILLSPLKIKSFTNFTFSFYYRRIYRIFPLYLLNIFATIIIVPVFSYTLQYPAFLSQIKATLTFSTNFSMYFENLNYFNKNLSFQWFKHYWSLGVEMQFYSIIPFLAYFCRKFPTKINLFLIWPLLIAGSQCLSVFMLANFEQKGNNFTFGMLPTRIWQFAGGFCAYYSLKFFDEIDNCKVLILLLKCLRHSITTNILSALIFTITLFPIILNQSYAQIATIILTSILVAGIGRIKDNEDLLYSFLANRFIVFIGDASYSLYISHWILVTLSNVLYEYNEANRRFMLCLCLIIGIVVHRWIEKPVCKAKLRPKEFFSILFFVYLAIVFGVLTMNTSTPSTTSSLLKDIFHNKSKLISNQTQWRQFASTINPGLAADLAIYTTKFGCNYFPPSAYAESFNALHQSDIKGAELKGSGNLSILVIGNSHAECFFPAVKLALEGIYSELNLFLAGGATPFEGFIYSRTGHLLKDAVIHYKPDVIFFVFKYQPDMDLPPTEPIETDFGTIKIQEMINFLSNHSKILLIGDTHFEADRFNALIFAEAMHHNGWVGDYKFPQSDLENRHTTSNRRWKIIKCKNCIFMNFLQAYCRNQWCSPVDATGKVPLVFDDNHLTSFGSYLLVPFLRDYIEKMNEILILQ